VRPALPGSYEALFHDVEMPRFLLDLARRRGGAGALREPRLERAIGVIYRPETERQSHYFHARLPDQFDAVLHFDETRAVEPLEQLLRSAGVNEEHLALLAPGAQDEEVDGVVTHAETEEKGAGKKVGGAIGRGLGIVGGITARS
jgi:hypothetical protein